MPNGMLETASTSVTSVNFYETARRNIPEDSHLHTSCRENLKSHSCEYGNEQSCSMQAEISWLAERLLAFKEVSAALN
jgi:hypothetical protein